MELNRFMFAAAPFAIAISPRRNRIITYRGRNVKSFFRHIGFWENFSRCVWVERPPPPPPYDLTNTPFCMGCVGACYGVGGGGSMFCLVDKIKSLYT